MSKSFAVHVFLLTIAVSGCGYMDEELFLSDEAFQEGLQNQHGVGGLGGGSRSSRGGGMNFRGMSIRSSAGTGKGASRYGEGSGFGSIGDRGTKTGINDSASELGPQRVVSSEDPDTATNDTPRSWGEYFVHESTSREERLEEFIRPTKPSPPRSR